MVNYYNKLEIYPRLVYFDILKQLKLKIDIYILSHHQDNPLNFYI